MMVTSSIDTTCTVWALETGLPLLSSLSVCLLFVGLFLDSVIITIIDFDLNILTIKTITKSSSGQVVGRVSNVNGLVKSQLIAHEKEVTIVIVKIIIMISTILVT